MAYAHVQSTSAQRTGTSNPTLAYTGNLVAGNLAVVDYSIFNAGLNSMAWSVGASASPTSATEALNGGSAVRTGIRYSANTSSGAHTASLTLSAAQDCTIAVHEYSGITTTSPLDPSPQIGTGTGTSLATASTSTLTQANNLVHATITHDGGNISETAGASFTARQTVTNGNTGMPIMTEDRRVTATTAVTGTATIGASQGWAIAVAVFLESGAAAATSFPPFRRPYRFFTRRS